MGQYYMPAIIHDDGRIESLYSHAFSSGLKLMEHSWIGNDFVNAVYSEICKNPKKIAWLGDYSNDFTDNDGEAYHEGMTLEEFSKYYDAVWGEEVQHLGPTDMVAGSDSILDMDTRGTYLVNHTKRVFLDMGLYTKRATTPDGWCVNPLPLLTACGNGRGGGDFRDSGNSRGGRDIGTWAFDKLEYTNEQPDSFTEVHFVFREEYQGIEENESA